MNDKTKWVFDQVALLAQAFPFQYKAEETQALLVKNIVNYDLEVIKKSINEIILECEKPPTIAYVCNKIKSYSRSKEPVTADARCRICEGTGMIKKKVKGYNMPLDFACECLRLRY